jgi:hypothetical protein
VDVLIVRFSGAAQQGKASAVIDSPSGSFRLQFDFVPNRQQYFIDFDRLWFRTLIGPHPRASVPIAGAEVTQETQLRDDGVLY